MMNQEINFSHHAKRRTFERVSMELYEIEALLEQDLTVKIGEEKGSRRIHRLFYSYNDNKCFVAIHDEKTKTVVTILPVDYYARIFWEVAPSLINEATALVTGDYDRYEISDSKFDGSQQDQYRPRSFLIKGRYISPEGWLRTLNLGSWLTEPYGGSFEKLCNDDTFFQEIENRFDKNKKTSSDRLIGFQIRLGNRGDIIWVKATGMDGIKYEINNPPDISKN